MAWLAVLFLHHKAWHCGFRSYESSTKIWLKKHGLVASRLTILDALAPTLVPHRAKYIPILDKHVMSRVFDEVSLPAGVQLHSPLPMCLCLTGPAHCPCVSLSVSHMFCPLPMCLSVCVSQVLPIACVSHCLWLAAPAHCLCVSLYLTGPAHVSQCLCLTGPAHCPCVSLSVSHRSCPGVLMFMSQMSCWRVSVYVPHRCCPCMLVAVSH